MLSVSWPISTVEGLVDTKLDSYAKYAFFQRFSMHLGSGETTLRPGNASYEANPSLPGQCKEPSHVTSSLPLLTERGFHSKENETWPHSFFFT